MSNASPDLIRQTIQLLGSVLQLGARTADMHVGTQLMGSIPELDSMAVVSLLAAIEEQFGVSVEDDDIDASVFQTVGSLAAFIAEKMPG
jgi:acyl carrier protein